MLGSTHVEITICVLAYIERVLLSEAARHLMAILHLLFAPGSNSDHSIKPKN